MICHIQYLGNQNGIVETLKRDIIPDLRTDYTFYAAPWDQALQSLSQQTTDVLICEVKKREQLEILALVKKQWPHIQLIIIELTVFDVADIFTAHPYDVWDIPLDRYRMMKTLKELICYFESVSDDAPVYELITKQGRVILPIQRIMYFEKQQRKIMVKTSDGQYDFYGTIKALKDENEICDHFVQTHQGFLVNKQHIKCIGHDDVKLFHQDEGIPLSRRYRQQLINE